MTKAKIAEHALEHPLVDRLRGKAFIPGVHYAIQAEAWMAEAADRISELEAGISVVDAMRQNGWSDNEIGAAMDGRYRGREMDRHQLPGKA